MGGIWMLILIRLGICVRFARGFFTLKGLENGVKNPILGLAPFK